MINDSRRRDRLSPTELSTPAGEPLLDVWLVQPQPLSGEDVTAFSYYTPTTPKVTPGQRPRTWLLTELDELDERLSDLMTQFDSFEASWDLESPKPQLGPRPLRVRALSAVRRVMDALSLPESRVAELAGVSRNSVRNWRHGQDAYPSTVARLLRISSLLGALDRSLGRDGLVTWLNEPGTDSSSRLDLLFEPEGPAVLARQAADILFTRPASALPPRELLGLDQELDFGDDGAEYAPQVFTARSRRQRPGPPP